MACSIYCMLYLSCTYCKLEEDSYLLRLLMPSATKQNSPQLTAYLLMTLLNSVVNGLPFR